jgi:hypothetical protein
MTTTPSPSPTTATTKQSVAAAKEIDALQAALAGEHAAVYAYGVIAALLADDDRERAGDLLADHEKRRNRLRELLQEASATPVAARAAYNLQLEARDRESAKQLAAALERGLGAAYTDLVATSDSEIVRKAAIGGVTRSAKQVARWTGETSAFPGLDDRPGTPVTE